MMHLSCENDTHHYKMQDKVECTTRHNLRQVNARNTGFMKNGSHTNTYLATRNDLHDSCETLKPWEVIDCGKKDNSTFAVGCILLHISESSFIN